MEPTLAGIEPDPEQEGEFVAVFSDGSRLSLAIDGAECRAYRTPDASRIAEGYPSGEAWRVSWFFPGHSSPRQGCMFTRDARRRHVEDAITDVEGHGAEGKGKARGR